MRDFYEHLPIAASTKQVLDASALLFQKLAATESLEKQQELVEKIREEESQILEDDPVYVQVSEYIQAIAGMNAGAETGSDGGPGSEAASGVGDAKVLLGRTLGGQQPLIEVVVDIEDVDDEEDEINRVGDVLFKDSSGSGGGFSPSTRRNGATLAFIQGADECMTAILTIAQVRTMTGSVEGRLAAFTTRLKALCTRNWQIPAGDRASPVPSRMRRMPIAPIVKLPSHACGST